MDISSIFKILSDTLIKNAVLYFEIAIKLVLVEIDISKTPVYRT